MRRFGAIRDPYDKKDFIKNIPIGSIPEEGSGLGKYLGRPYMQFVGSCTGESLNKAYEILRRKKLNHSEIDDRVPKTSPLFSYAMARKLSGWPDRDIGSSIRNAMLTSVKYGFIPEKEYSNGNDWKSLPDANDFSLANLSVMEAVERIPNDKDQFESVLRVLFIEKLPIVFGCELFTEFFEETRRDGIIRMPKPSSKSMGYHAMVFYEGDQKNENLMVINSHGNDGINGTYVMSREYQEKYVIDSWTFNKDLY